MEQEGKYWPSEVDRQPKLTVWHVRTVPLQIEQPYSEEASGMVGVTVTESSDIIEERLRNSFPAYRIIQWGRELLNLSGEQHEV